MLKPKISIRDKTRAYQQLLDAMSKLNGSYTKVGFPEGVAVANVTGGESSSISEVAEIAAFNEFGTVRVPARPFFRQAIDNNREGLRSFIKQLQPQIVTGTMSALQGLQLIGEWMTAKVKGSITNGDFAPNSPITIARKHGSSRPLIDSGQMRQSVNHVEHVSQGGALRIPSTSLRIKVEQVG